MTSRPIRLCKAITLSVIALATSLTARADLKAELVKVGDGYCRTSVNTAVFRGSSVISHGNDQYISFYDEDGYVVLGKRKTDDTKWTLHRTRYQGNIKDAHNVISIGVDGDGYIHASFDHHGNPLRYARSVAPGSLELGEMTSMTGGDDEKDVTYPEFYTMPGGDLIFAYRSGRSGQGNLVLNRYSVKDRKWFRLHDILIDGEGKRNAYWQMYVDPSGVMHLSWVWRETWMVETNHDLCYARSKDGGKTWERSDGTKYSLPITMDSAEVAWAIPQKSELINQTSMTADADGHPYIATYWRDADSSVPQYRLVWHDGGSWKMNTVGDRKEPFSLAGGGTKMIPVSRPRIACDGKKAYYIFRDTERGSKVSIAYTPEIGKSGWTVTDVTGFPVDAWEPSFDTNLWNDQRKLHIYVQTTHQGDGEKVADASEASSPVYILEIDSAADRIIRLDNVDCTVYLPDPSMSTGRAVVILPGGGYSHHAMDHEGHQWAPFFNRQGIAAAVLRYRLPNGDRNIPMNDVKATFRIMRDSAANWKINPHDIGIMGSSAGGHLASTIATHTDGAEKPDFQILFYPVVSLDPAITHAGTRTGFLGKNPVIGDQEEYSNANVVDATTPPAIIFHSNDDKAVHPMNSIGYYTALQKAGVPAALHIYPVGGHGWGYRSSFPFHDHVLDELRAWLRFLPSPEKINSLP